jgi:hypothetical protein
LLSLVVAAGSGKGAARPPEGVEFVDKDDRRGFTAGLLEL